MSLRFCWRCGTRLDAVPPTTCGACGEVHYLNPKPCANAVVVADGRVLMALRARDPAADRWTVPGGFCEGDEHPIAACERELREETGLRGCAVAYLGTWMDVYGPPQPDGLLIHTAVAGYLVELEGDDDAVAAARPDPSEVVRVQWFAWDALPDAIAFPAHIPAMLDAARAMIASDVLPPLPDRPA